MKQTKAVGKTRHKLPKEIGLKRSSIHGYGVYARDFIPQGTQLLEYIGERITKAEAVRREDQRLERLAAGGDGCVYIFDLNQRYDLDGRVTGNVARRINHSCEPNCESQVVKGRVWIAASRDIAPGEELSFDYGFAFSEWRKHPCRCGAKECAGFIVNSGQRWRVRKILAAAAATKTAT